MIIINRKKYKLLVGVFIFWLIIVALYFITEILVGRTEISSLIYMWSVISVLLTIMCAVTWVQIDEKILSPYLIFFAFLVTFSLGQCLLWSFGIHPDNELRSGTVVANVLISAYDILKAQKFTCICIVSFHIGAIITQIIKLPLAKSVTSNAKIFNAMKIVGIIIGVICVPITLFRTVTYYNVARTYGYRGVYYGGYVDSNPIYQIAEFFFFPSLVCFLIGNKYSKTSRLIVYLLFGAYMILGILYGDRGSWLYKVIVLFWIHLQYSEKFNTKKWIKCGVIAIGLIYIVGAITNVRNTDLSNLSIGYIIESLSLAESPIFTNISEMGRSMNIILVLLKYGNDIWPYVNTYITAILGALSSRIFALFGGEYVNLDSWFSENFLQLRTSGAGFSMVGEAYLNGGYVGAQIYMLLFGLILSKFLSWKFDDSPNEQPLKLFFVATTLNTFVGYTRGALYVYIKQWLWGTLIVILFVILVSKFIKNRK